MSGEGRASRTSIQRTASVSRTPLQPCTLFAEPPVPLPNLDELRASDALIRAYYNDLAKAAAEPTTAHLISLAVSPEATAVNAKASDASSQAKAVATAEARAAGEVLCAALARDVVEAAARLYTSRRLDDLVESYTACATWDDACEVVASSFLTQDTYGSGVRRVTASGDSACLAAAANAPPAPSQLPLSTPIFMRSALALAGIATRKPTCTLTPQSSLSPPPLGMALSRNPPRAHNTAGPLPPANVPVDAFSRYVTVIEAAPPTQNTPEFMAASAQLRTAPTRPRVAKAAAKTTDVATAAVTAPSLSPVPPTTANPSAKKSARGTQRRSQPPSQSSSPLDTSPNRGKALFTTATAPPPDDPLTRALRHGQPAAIGESGIPGATRVERGPPRPAVGQSSSSLGDGGRKTNGKASPHNVGAAGSGSGAVVAVEQDRLWATERSTKAVARGGQRKDAVRCRVLTGDRTEVNNSAAAAAVDAMTTDVNSAKKVEAEQPVTANNKGGPRQPNGRGNTGAGKARKGVSAEREAWTASFFNATDMAGEMSLQDQVQVTPSPGVTVIGGAPTNGVTNAARRGNRAAANAGAVVHGGEFAVPADRLALSAFDEKRTGTRKTNGGGRLQSPGKVHPAQAFKTV